MPQRTISDLMADLAYCADDAPIHEAMRRLERLKSSASGDERAACHWALAECRELLTAGGRLRRHAAASARRSTIWVDHRRETA